MHFLIQAINLIQLKNDSRVPEIQNYVNLNPELAYLPFFFYNNEANVISIVMVVY